jgi:hypothetical protein
VTYTVIAVAGGCRIVLLRVSRVPETAGLRITDVIIALGFVCFGSVPDPGVVGECRSPRSLVLTEFCAGISLEAASGIALVLWIITFVVIVPLGLVMAFHEGIKWRSLRHIEVASSGYGL